MSSDTIRVASLGLGWWSDVLAEGVTNAKGIEVVSCFTRSEDKRKAFAEKFDCAYAGSYEELLADDSIDAIINTTPNNIHLETTNQAAEAGKHVFLDKPIANSVGEGMEIAKICRAAKVKLSIGFQRRRENHFRWVQQEIQAGRFGQIV
ncbi:MAG: Gfo/Idh/MocA family oxidoreductase, partial [Rhodospirillaceae bacterium]|nr:Gfo/Idh/MocA family oxidoreductase [Rhodospirillaceae bacterium]